MHTAQHIVNNCLTGSLAQDRTIILVTHHITLCSPIASYIVELSPTGSVLRHGSTHDLGLLQEIIKAEDEELPLSEESEKIINVEQLNLDIEQREQRKSAVEASGAVGGKLILAEARAEGRVSWRTYMTYFRATGIFSILLTVFLMVALRAIDLLNQVSTRFRLDYLTRYRSIWHAGEKHITKQVQMASSVRHKYP